MELNKIMFLKQNYNDTITMRIKTTTASTISFNYRLLEGSDINKHPVSNYGFIIYECENGDDIKLKRNRIQYFDANDEHVKDFDGDMGLASIINIELRNNTLYALGLYIKATEGEKIESGIADLMSIAYFRLDGQKPPASETTTIGLNAQCLKDQSAIVVNYSVPKNTQADIPKLCKHFVRIYETEQKNLFISTDSKYITHQLITDSKYNGEVTFSDKTYKDLKPNTPYTVAYCHSIIGGDPPKSSTLNFVSTFEFMWNENAN